MVSSMRGAAMVAACLMTLACSGAAPYPSGGPVNQPPEFPPPPVRPPVQPLPPAATAAPFPNPVPVPAATPDYPAPVDFEDAGVNPFVDPARDRFSTFAMDVDTASYGVTRRFLHDGFMPDRDSVRLEEFVNSFDYGYEPPTDTAFAIHVDGGPTPFTPTRSVLLRIGIQAREVPEEMRTPVSLTFVIDTSGSMDMEGRLQLVKAALGLLVTRLRADDSVAIVAFNDTANVILNPTSAAEPQVILSAVNALQPGGSTNAQAGLELGYDLALLGHRAGALDRVVMASDGVANVGLTDADSILQRIDR